MRWQTVFSPWRWPRWAWSGVVPLILVAYFLTPPVTAQIANRTNLSPFLGQCIGYVEWPIFAIVGKSTIVSAIYQCESKMIEAVFGPPLREIEWADGNLYIQLDSAIAD